MESEGTEPGELTADAPDAPLSVVEQDLAGAGWETDTSGEQLFDALAKNNMVVAGGTLDTGNGSFNVEVPGLITTAQDVYNLPLKTEITPLLIVIKLEQFDYNGAAALGFMMLLVSFLMLFAINLVQSWSRRRHSGPVDSGRRVERRRRPRNQKAGA